MTTDARTVPVPVNLSSLPSLGQLLIVALLAQYAESKDGTVCLSPRTMRRHRWYDPGRVDRARRQCERHGLLQRVLPYRQGTAARYRLAWLEGAA